MRISDWSSDVCSSDLIIILNTNFRKFFKDFSVNYYIFNKYSFFNIFEHKLGYFLFDRFLFNIFLKDFSVLSEEYSKLTNGITLEKHLNDISFGNIFQLIVSIYNVNIILSY